MLDVEEMGLIIGELKGDQFGNVFKCAGQLPVRAGDEACGFPRVADTELVPDWPGRTGL